MPLGSCTATRSPGVSPRAANPAATRSTAASSSLQLSRRSPATTAGASGRYRAAARTSADSVVPSDTGFSSIGVLVDTPTPPGRSTGGSETCGVAWTDCSDVVTMGLAPQHARRTSGPGATGGAARGSAGRRGGRSARMPPPRPLDAARQETAAAESNGRPTPYPRPRPSPRPRPTPFPRAAADTVPSPRPELSPDAPVEPNVVEPNVVVDPAPDAE